MNASSSPCVFLLECDLAIAQTIDTLCNKANLMLCHFQSWELMHRQLQTLHPCCLILSASHNEKEVIEHIVHITIAHDHPPVIVLGQSQNFSAAVASIQAGAIDYIEKPVISGRLEQHIANLEV